MTDRLFGSRSNFRSASSRREKVWNPDLFWRMPLVSLRSSSARAAAKNFHRPMKGTNLMRSTLDLTIADLRALIRYDGAESDTIGTALQRMADADAAQREHDALWAEFEAYRARRQQRRDAAIADAAAAADRDRQGRGDGERMAARQSARAEAAEAFERREPPLEFAGWQDAGRPDVHEIGGRSRPPSSRVKEFVL